MAALQRNSSKRELKNRCRSPNHVTSKSAHNSANNSPFVPNGMAKTNSAGDELNEHPLDLSELSSHHQRVKSHGNDKEVKDYRVRYDRKCEQNRQLNLKVMEQDFTINNLQKELRKFTSMNHSDATSADRNYQRTIKHKEREIANLRRRLKLAINDYEKVYLFYKKQLDVFKRNQQKWLQEQKAKHNSNHQQVTKYVFADDIRKIKILRNGAKIYFADGESVDFKEIEIIQSTNTFDDSFDDDQYRNLVDRVRNETDSININCKHSNSPNGNGNVEEDDLDDDDMIILCLNELNARIRDFRNRNHSEYDDQIQKRYDALPIYHIDGVYLEKLKTSNRAWIRLFRESNHLNPSKSLNASNALNASNSSKSCASSNVLKSKEVTASTTSTAMTASTSSSTNRFAAFFNAQKEMESGKQPTICLRNNITLKHINDHKKDDDTPYSLHLQQTLNAAISRRNATESTLSMDPDAVNVESDEDEEGLEDVSVLNGWWTAQREMQIHHQQPSVCIKNGVELQSLQRAQPKFKIKRKIKGDVMARNLQRKLDDAMRSNHRYSGHQSHGGHGTLIDKDIGDSSQDEDKEEEKEEEETHSNGLSVLQNGWFTAQRQIAQNVQPTLCVQHKVELEHIGDRGKDSLNSIKNEKSTKAMARNLQSKLNENTSHGLPSNAVDLSDDEDSDHGMESMESIMNNENESDCKMNEDAISIRGDAWYWKNRRRSEGIKSIKITAEKKKTLQFVAGYFNRILPTSMDYGRIKSYLPIHPHAHDVVATCFDGVLLAVLINLVDDDLIDLRALHLPSQKCPITKAQIVENIHVIKLCIAHLDLHEFPDFHVEFSSTQSIENDSNEALEFEDDPDAFCWFNPKFTVDILLLIVQHTFQGMMNRKVNILKYPQLLRLCQSNEEQENARKQSARQWLDRWIVFIKDTKHQKQSIGGNGDNGNMVSCIDLGDYNAPNESELTELDSIWIPDRNLTQDILSVEHSLNVQLQRVKTIVRRSDIIKCNEFLQIIYVSDLFVHQNRLQPLSASEQKASMKYRKPRGRDDQSLIAWINASRVSVDGTNQYIDNLEEDLSDGAVMLSLLDRCYPGCVDWENVDLRSSLRRRNRFEKLQVCNRFIEIWKSSCNDLGDLVGVDGNDIWSGNIQIIRSLLVRMQRYHSRKLMANILFQKRAVSDEELLNWMNLRLQKYKVMVNGLRKMHRNDAVAVGGSTNVKMRRNLNIESFDDAATLSDCISFCNVLSSIDPELVNYAFVNGEEECETKRAKIENAKYLITMTRRTRLAADNVFMTPKELVNCTPRAVMAMATAVMTIAAQYNRRNLDHLVLFHRELKKATAQLQQK